MTEKDKNLENQNENVNENGSGNNEPANDTGANNPETNGDADNNDSITLTNDELAKRIQSAEDKLRTKYSKQIKELEKKLKDATPVQKSEQELDYEQRLAKLEARERAQELNEALDAKGIDRNMAKFLKQDVSVDDLASVIDTLVTSRNKQNSYVPSGHKSGESLTKEDFKRMNMDEKEKLFNEQPELYRALARQ